jgi:vesicle-fusing ATPase
MVGKCPDPSLALNNKIYVSKSTAKKLRCRDQEQYAQVGDAVYIVRPHKGMEDNLVGLNTLQRRFGEFAYKDRVDVIPYILGVNDRNFYLSQIRFEVKFWSAKFVVDEPFDLSKLHKRFLEFFQDHFFSVGQSQVLDFQNSRLVFTAADMHAVDMAAALAGRGAASSSSSSSASSSSSSSASPSSESSDSVAVQRGLLMESTQLVIARSANSTIKLSGGGQGASMARGGQGTGGSMASGGLFRADWSFESMGIGGLDNQFSQIFRRAFASRLFPPSVIAKLGIRHTRGILLYGPPGTGKTLMARQIGRMLNGKEPKVVNGPEILDKYVGASEENIRNLFADAEAEYKARGEESDMHIIIFDEIDAICKTRGSTRGGTGVQDTVVNQLLSKIDGVDSLNNILVIGMTNRKDMIDEALLRPGRLEVQMEISLPDENGRVQIFRIHTAKMQANGFLAADVDIDELATLTKNYTGAEIEGVVNSATSFALNRQVDMDNLSSAPNADDTNISRADFLRALQEVPPAFGVTADEFSGCTTNGIISFGANFAKLDETCVQFIKQVQHSRRTPVVSVLLEGLPGSGKTALAAMLAQRSGFPFIKLISPERLVGMGDATRCDRITRIFEDAYKSPLSAIVVDDIERLLNYAPIGPHFSNHVLQTLLVLLKRQPPGGRKLLVIGTTSNARVLENLEFMEVFNAVLHVPNVRSGDECATVLRDLGGWTDADIKRVAPTIDRDIPIKKLIMISEMALQGDKATLPERFARCYSDYSGSLLVDLE